MGTMVGDLNIEEFSAIKARTYLGLRSFPELKAMKDSKNPGEAAASQMAIFLNSAQPAQKEEAGRKIVEMARTTRDINATNLAAAFLAHQGEYVEALNLIQDYSTLEMKALKIHIYLLMSRPDLATPVVAEMNRTAEDSSITKMCHALVQFASGNYQEAFLTYCDIQALYGEEMNDAPSTMLLNCKAACNLHRGSFPEALEDTERACKLNPKDADALINMIAVSIHLKQDHTSHFQTLKERFPLHPFVHKVAALDDAFQAFY